MDCRLDFRLDLEITPGSKTGGGDRRIKSAQLCDYFRQYTGNYFRIAVLLSCSTTCITSTPWTRKMPGRSPADPQPIPSRSPAEARGRRPGAGRRRAWESRGHFGGRCCLTAGPTTDQPIIAKMLRACGI
jgi:hypothetical protein